MTKIKVEGLKKNFKVYKKAPGFMGAVESLFKREYIEIPAVKDISFEIGEGELVGFIGANGAGKTTTIKCLSGLLMPSEGSVNVLGFDPFQRDPRFLKQISLIMGQKNQLWWDLPAIETFLLNKEIYDVDDSQFKKTVGELSELLDVTDVLRVQVRNLSLGQRMKCELIAALIHQPKVLFLDEPTIGLDVVMQKNLRSFIKEYNRIHKSTILLTSHYMTDVEELCERIIIIDHGQILYDGSLDLVIKKFAKNKLITAIFKKPVDEKKLSNLGTIKDYSPLKVKLEVAVAKSNQVSSALLKDFPVQDLTIEDPEIEDIIRYIFMNKKV